MPEKYSGSMSEVRDFLEGIRKQYREAKRGGDFENWEEGVYTFRVENAQLRKSTRDSKYRVSFEFMCVADGGERLYETYRGTATLYNLHSSSSIANLKQLLRDIGYPAEDSVVLDRVLEKVAAEKPVFKAYLKSREMKSGGTWQDIEVVGRVETDGKAPKGKKEKKTSDTLDQGIKKGDRISIRIEGEDYAGTVAKVRGGLASVEFDDGDVQWVPVDQLEAVTEEEEKEEVEGDDPDDQAAEAVLKGNAKEEPDESEDEEEGEESPLDEVYEWLYDRFEEQILSEYKLDNTSDEEFIEEVTRLLKEEKFYRDNLTDEEIGMFERAGIPLPAKPGPKGGRKKAKRGKMET